MIDKYGIDGDNLPFKNGDTVVIPDDLSKTKIEYGDPNSHKIKEKYIGKRGRIQNIILVLDTYSFTFNYIEGYNDEDEYKVTYFGWSMADFINIKQEKREVKLKKSNKDLLGI